MKFGCSTWVVLMSRAFTITMTHNRRLHEKIVMYTGNTLNTCFYCFFCMITIIKKLLIYVDQEVFDYKAAVAIIIMGYHLQSNQMVLY